MVAICLKILDRNIKHYADPGADVSTRGNPVDVGRMVSAMVGQLCVFLHKPFCLRFAEISECSAMI